MVRLVRALVAGLVGGFLMFAWGAVAHMMLQLGDGGMRPFPGEAEALAPLTGQLCEPGIYYAPMPPEMASSSAAADEAMRTFEERHRTGPVAFLVWTPIGGEVMPPWRLGTEFASNAIAAFLAAIVVSQMSSGYIARVLACVFIGLCGWLSISASNGIWWNFPPAYVHEEAIEQAVGWLISGIAIAAIAGCARGRCAHSSHEAPPKA